MAGQDELDALIRGRVESGAHARDMERMRRDAEAARQLEVEKNRLQREQIERETNTPGRVNRGLREWINPEMYRLPGAPARPQGMLPLPAGPRGALPPELLFALLRARRGMLG